MKNDALLFNKIAAGILSAALLAMGLGALSGGLYQTDELEQHAYVISTGEPVAASSAGAAAPAGPEPVSALLAAADIAKGEKTAAKKCGSCHTFNDGGSTKQGPNLFGIMGRAKAGVAGFGYSSAMANFGGDWSYEDMNGFLAKPKKFIPKTKMAFPGFKKVGDRANVIAYLRTLSASPIPLP